MKKKKILTAMIACALSVSVPYSVVIASENNSNTVNTYKLDDVNVDATKDEEVVNPYITGGDVQVIRREVIEKHNYTTIVDALKTIPGIQVSTPGYKGGEYGYAGYNTEVSINGENNIIILVDGRRVDNDANTYAGTKARVNISTLPGINNVEQIEVIKGTGSSIYGSDSAGGVINIVTRKGSKQPKTTIDIASGSWGRHNYALSHTGSSEDGSIQYAASLSRQMSGNSQYQDVYTGKSETYSNTGFRDENASFNIKKDFDKKHSLELTYNHSYEKAFYPITAPDYRYYSSFLNGTMATVNPLTHRYTGLNSSAPGYRNIFLYDAWLGSYDETLSNNIDLKYVFGKTDELAESYFRVYKNYTRYNTTDYSSIWNVPYPYLSEFLPTAKSSGNFHSDIEEVIGTALQMAKHTGKNSLIAGIKLRKSKYEYHDSSSSYESSRNAFDVYFQDKIKISEKFTTTPGFNYAHYSDGNYKNVNFGGASKLTFSSYSSYDFDKNTNMYFSISQIFKPVSGLDYSRALSIDPLQNEEGYNYNIGVNKKITQDDSVSVNFGNTSMSNAIARYSVLNTSTGAWQSKAINAVRNKKALNIGYTHSIDKTWNTGISYSWVNENFYSKNVQKNPDGTNPDELINAYRPKNIYRMNVSYDKGPWSADLAYTIYSGNNIKYFTGSSFGVLDLAINYKLTKDTQVYFNVNNVLNKAYETKALAAYGPGALPESGRNFMLGVKYSF